MAAARAEAEADAGVDAGVDTSVDAGVDTGVDAGVDASVDAGTGAGEAVIPQFYADRELFITGVTGFLGKVVAARVLAACPRVRRLHALVRARPPAAPADRLRDIKQSPVFDPLRRSSPRQLDKLVVVAGDISEHNLGLSDQDIAELQAVSVVINAAAMVKLDEQLAAALHQNVRSVQQLLDICDRLPNLEALVHVSTAFCGSEHPRLEERVCAAPRALGPLLRDAAAPMTTYQAKKFISPKPNTYTFTKMLAENVVAQRAYAGYSRAIFRPTIGVLIVALFVAILKNGVVHLYCWLWKRSSDLVERILGRREQFSQFEVVLERAVISSLREPFPGWVEKLHGPSGVAAGVLSGALRVMRVDAAARADMLPVDIAADTLIAVAWETAIDRQREVRVYNCAAAENATNWEQLRRCLVATSRAAPSERALWRPNITYVKSKFKHRIAEFIWLTLPLFFADIISRIFCNDKDRVDLRRVAARLRAMNAALEYFATRSFWFPAGAVRRLRARMTSQDAALFNLDPNTIDWPLALSQLVLGARRHLLREPDATAPAARKRLRRLYDLCVGSAAVAAAAAAWAAHALCYDSSHAPSLLNQTAG